MASARRAGSQQATRPAIASVRKIVAGIQKPGAGMLIRITERSLHEQDAEHAAEHAADRADRSTRRR